MLMFGIRPVPTITVPASSVISLVREAIKEWESLGQEVFAAPMHQPFIPDWWYYDLECYQWEHEAMTGILSIWIDKMVMDAGSETMEIKLWR